MINIRTATDDDVEQLHELGKEVNEFSVNEKTVNFWPKETLLNAIQSDDVIILIAEGESGVLGFIIATYSRGLKKSTVENVFVSPANREDGVGENLLKSLIDLLRELGCEYIATLIPLDAQAASSLYKSAGFSEGEAFNWLDLSITDNFKRI